jgi:hypothetical protein
MFFKFFERLKYLLFDVENDWEIGISESSFSAFLEKDRIPKITWFKNPKNVFWADPFGIKLQQHYYIFFEEFDKETQYGNISCLILDERKKIVSKEIIIDEKIHFSFPQVFFFKDNYYMLPETHQKHKLSLYTATKFPNKWEEKYTLLNLPCVDSLLFFKQGIWYLFYSIIGSKYLFLRKNSNLTDNWENCIEETINTNPFNARNAGSIIIHNNKNFRVSQNCISTYGKSIVINEVDEISENNFSEKIVKEIKMKQQKMCTHTLNVCDDIVLIDRRRERLFLKTIRKIFSKIKKIVF